MQAVYVLSIIFYLSLVLAYIINHVLSKKGIDRAWRVRRILKRLDRGQYNVYHDIHIPVGKNKLAKVDHLITSRYGIIIIETRNYVGWEAGYIKALESHLSLDKRFFSTLFAVPDKSNPKFEGNFIFANTVRFSELLQTISEYEWKLISEERLQKVNKKMDRLMILNKNGEKEFNKEIVQPVRSGVQQAKVISFNRSKCPKCHSELVKRNGNYGGVVKCSNSTGCKYTKNITG